MKAPRAQPSVELGGKMGSGENKEQKADVELKELQPPPEVFLHLLRVITSSSFQPTHGAIALLDI